MIRYLQRLKAKKGFTMVELVIVIGIIAVLAAVILSNSGTENKKIQAANNAAQDFYSTVQYSFTKYMKYEADLSIAIAEENKGKTNDSDKIMMYYPLLNGNYPTNRLTFVKMFVNRNQIQYVQTFKTPKDMINETSTSCKSKFDELLKNDFDTVMESNVDGYYYALVTFEGSAVSAANVKSAPVKVHSAYYSARPFAEVAGDVTTYRVNNLEFESYCRLSNENICGVCSSAKYDDSDGNKVFLGEEDTYFMGATDSGGELIVTLGT